MEPMTVTSTALDLTSERAPSPQRLPIRHGSEPIELRTVLEPTSIRVEVSDCGPEMPISSVEKPEAIGGRGLGIIEAIAQAWGYDRHGDDGGKTVWFTLPRTVRI